MFIYMKYIKKLCESFKILSKEELFGKETTLEKQYNDIIVSGLVNDETDKYWATFYSLSSEILKQIGKNNILYKELMHRIVENEDPTTVIEDICNKVNKTNEIKRLLSKL